MGGRGHRQGTVFRRGGGAAASRVVGRGAARATAQPAPACSLCLPCCVRLCGPSSHALPSSNGRLARGGRCGPARPGALGWASRSPWPPLLSRPPHGVLPGAPCGTPARRAGTHPMSCFAACLCRWHVCDSSRPLPTCLWAPSPVATLPPLPRPFPVPVPVPTPTPTLYGWLAATVLQQAPRPPPPPTLFQPPNSPPPAIPPAVSRTAPHRQLPNPGYPCRAPMHLAMFCTAVPLYRRPQPAAAAVAPGPAGSARAAAQPIPAPGHPGHAGRSGCRSVGLPVGRFGRAGHRSVVCLAARMPATSDSLAPCGKTGGRPVPHISHGINHHWPAPAPALGLPPLDAAVAVDTGWLQAEGHAAHICSDDTP